MTAQGAEGPDRPRWVEVQKDRCGSDASACARRDEAADAAHRLRDLAGGDAEKLAGRERDVREQDAWCLQAHRFVLSAQRDAVVELCTRGAAPSAERSYAAQAAAADLPSPAVRQDAEKRERPEAQKRRRPKEVRERLAQLSKRQAAQRDAPVEARAQATRVQLPKQRAFLPARMRQEAAVRARVLKEQRAVALQPAKPALRPEVQLRAWLLPETEGQGQDVPAVRQPIPSFE